MSHGLSNKIKSTYDDMKLFTTNIRSDKENIKLECDVTKILVWIFVSVTSWFFFITQFSSWFEDC